jgi:hypothetical protein
MNILKSKTINFADDERRFGRIEGRLNLRPEWSDE